MGKYCLVPRCKSTSFNAPEKIFLTVPMEKKRRMKWMRAIRRLPGDISENACVFVCQDHFNMDDDVENILKYRLGFTDRLRVKPGVVPHIFHCQEDHPTAHKNLSKPKRLPAKRKRLQLLEDAMQLGYSEETSQSYSEPKLWIAESGTCNVEGEDKFTDAACQTEFDSKNASTQTDANLFRQYSLSRCNSIKTLNCLFFSKSPR